MDDLDTLILACIAKKEGDKAFLLWAESPGKWVAAIGNKSSAVAIGEVITYGEENVDFVHEGSNPVQAVKGLLAQLDKEMPWSTPSTTTPSPS